MEVGTEWRVREGGEGRERGSEREREKRKRERCSM